MYLLKNCQGRCFLVRPRAIERTASPRVDANETPRGQVGENSTPWSKPPLHSFLYPSLAMYVYIYSY